MLFRVFTGRCVVYSGRESKKGKCKGWSSKNVDQNAADSDEPLSAAESPALSPARHVFKHEDVFPEFAKPY